MSKKTQNFLIEAGVTIVLASILAIVFPSAAHDVIYTLAFSPAWIAALAILVIGGLFVAVSWTGSAPKKSQNGVFGFIGTVFVLLAIYFLFALNDTTKQHMTYSFTPKVISISDLGDTDVVRFNAYDIAKTKFKNSQTVSSMEAGDIDPLVNGDQINWIGPILPAKFGAKFSAQTKAIATINEKNEFDPDESANFNCSENGFYSHNVYNLLNQERYFAYYPEIYYVEHENEWIMVAPFVVPEFHFPIFIESWGGVMVLDANCNVEELTPAQAQIDPRLENTNIKPAYLALEQAKPWGYRFGGLIHNLWYQENQIEIHDLENSENTQPYYLSTELGTMWTIAAEPAGGSFAVSTMFLFSTRSNDVYVIQFDNAHSIIGPSAGVGYAEGGVPGYTWRENVENPGDYTMLEPRPFIKDGVWYWMYTVVKYNPNDERTKYGDTSLIALLDSERTSIVLRFCTREALYRWKDGLGKPDSQACSGTEYLDPTDSIAIMPAQGQSGTLPIQDLNTLSDEDLWNLIIQAQEILRSRQGNQ